MLSYTVFCLLILQLSNLKQSLAALFSILGEHDHKMPTPPPSQDRVGQVRCSQLLKLSTNAASTQHAALRSRKPALGTMSAHRSEVSTTLLWLCSLWPEAIFVFKSQRWSPCFVIQSAQFSSVAQSCPTLCNPMNRSTPGLPVHHQLPEFTQTHVHDESVMPSSHLILCRPLLLLPPIPRSIRVFSNESTLHMRRPKYLSFSFSISPSNEHPGLISFRMDWLDLLAG